ncbi:MAG: nucleotidyltransferase [Gemmatimonadetes bacterium]|nr:nucleotidyltransferase [Gemmatimonadota bacterium]
MTPQSCFTSFLRDIEPSPTTKSDASTAHTNLRTYLRNHSEFKYRHVNSYLSGSYKRDTAIRPRRAKDGVERPDIDIIVEINFRFSDNPKGVVSELYNTISAEYDVCRPQDRSVGIFTPKAEMDVVPIIKYNGILYIPDRKAETWHVTNPPKHTQWTTQINNQADGRFKPLVKMMKWWRRVNPTKNKKPKGFVIECIVAECMDYDESHYGKLVVKTFENIVSRYAVSVGRGQLPFIQDPGVSSNSVTEGMTISAFEGFYNKAKAHSVVARQALAADNPAEQTRLWRIIFGDRFPVVKSNMNESLLGAALSSAKHTFPNEPIRPDKPSGFA